MIRTLSRYNIVRMIKNLTTIGNSLGIIIDKSVLDLLGIQKDTPIEITTDGRRLILEPVEKQARRERLSNAIDRVTKNHAKTVEKLAK